MQVKFYVSLEDLVCGLLNYIAHTGSAVTLLETSKYMGVLIFQVHLNLLIGYISLIYLTISYLFFLVSSWLFFLWIIWFVIDLNTYVYTYVYLQQSRTDKYQIRMMWCDGKRDM